MTMQLNPLKVFKLNLNSENIEELIGKAKLIKDIIKNLSETDIKNNKNEFIAFSNELNELLEDIDEILMKKYIKTLDDLFNEINSIIELISEKLGEYAVKEIIIKPAENHLLKNISKEGEFISFETALKELNAN